VIPIGNSTLYVEPLYLQAEQSPFPELKRVIVATGERVAMDLTLEQALNKLFGQVLVQPEKVPTEAAGSAAPATPGAPGLPKDVAQLTREAQQHFDAAQERLKQGDWAGYGDELQKLRDTLQSSQGGGRRDPDAGATAAGARSSGPHAWGSERHVSSVGRPIRRKKS